LNMPISRFRKTSRFIAAMRKDEEDAAKANELLRSRDITVCGDFLESPSNTERVSVAASAKTTHGGT